MSSQSQASTLGGVVSGAGSGAAAGTSIQPGIGTAIGAIAGGILGGIAGKKKADADIEQREEEIARVQRREDTAIRRAVQDSLAAGVDPRIQNQAPPSAGASSVDPYETPDYMNDIVAGMGQLQSAFSDRVKQRMDFEKSTLKTLNEGYDRYTNEKAAQASEYDKQANDLLSQMSTIKTTDDGSSKDFSTRLLDGVEDTSDTGTVRNDQNTKDSQNISLRDDLVQKFGKKTVEDFENWFVEGQFDADFDKIVRELLTEGLKKKLPQKFRDVINFIFSSYNSPLSQNGTHAPIANHASLVPGLGLGPTDNYTQEGAPLPQGSNSVGGSSGRVDDNGNSEWVKKYNPKSKEFEWERNSNFDQSGLGRNEGGESSSGTVDEKTHRNNFGIGVRGGYNNRTGSATEGGKQDNNRTVKGDKEDNYTEHTGYTLTTNDLRKLKILYNIETLSSDKSYGNIKLSGPDAETFARLMGRYLDLLDRRDAAASQATMPFSDYAKDRYQPAMDLIKLLRFGGLGR